MTDAAATGAGGPVHNRWRSWDAVEPVARWILRVAVPPEARKTLLVAVGTVLDETGLVRVLAVDVPGAPRFPADDARSWPEAWAAVSDIELLPFAPALLEGEGHVTLESRVTVRGPEGQPKTVQATDAGALLRALEPDLDEAYRRHFAAPHPFVGLWSQTSADVVEITVGFWSDIFEPGGPGLEENQARAAEAERRLRDVAEARGGTFTVEG